MFTRIFIIATALTLGACDQLGQKLGLEDPVKKEAEGKAVGSACRHSGRAIEDCYSIYKWLTKASIYAGWMEMDGYMRENNIETIAPVLPPPQPPEPPEKKKKKKKSASAEGNGEETGAAPAAESTAAASAAPEAAKDTSGKH